MIQKQGIYMQYIKQLGAFQFHSVNFEVIANPGFNLYICNGLD